MVRTSAFISVAVVAAGIIWLLGELAFLAPRRTPLVQLYGRLIAAFICVFAVNLFGLILAVNRRLFLRDTGRKLAHVEKQLRTGSSISEELTERLSE
jgi:hypothetical protein